MAAVAGRVQRRGGLGDVLAHDGDVADLAVALAELVVGQADAARIVGDLGLLQRAAVQRDRARLIAARRRQPAVQPPQRRQAAAAERSRGTCRAGGRAPRRPGRGRPGAATPRRASSAPRARPRASATERSAGASSCTASAPRPRSSAAPARASSACREDDGTRRV